MKKTLTERLLGRVAIDPTSGCWNWTGATFAQGYGKIVVGGKGMKTHRLAWMLFHSEIPPSIVLHHKCENTLCCNPLHLQPTDQGTHLVDLTPKSLPYRHKRMTHCKRGHPLTAENTEKWSRANGHRKCTVCSRMHEAAYRARQDPEALRARNREKMREYRARQRSKST